MTDNRRLKYYKYACIALLIGLSFVIQSARAFRIPFTWSQLDLFFMIIAATALFEGGISGGCVGLMCGMLMGLMGVPTPAGAMIFYSVFGVACGYLTQIHLRSHMLSAVILSVIGHVIYLVLAYMFYGAFVGIPLLPFLQGGLVSVTISALVCPIIYLAVRKVHETFTILE